MERCEIIIRTQDKSCWKKFEFPFGTKENDGKWHIFMGYEDIGCYSKKDYADRVTQFIMKERDYYLYGQKQIRSAVINVPEEELVRRQTDFSDSVDINVDET